MGSSKKEQKMASNMNFEVKNLQAHLDKRGWLVEMLKSSNIDGRIIRQVYVATINPGCIRGNHYHKKRKEWFFIADGFVKIFLENIDNGKQSILDVSSQKPRLVTIFPRMAHVVKNISEKKLI